MKTQKFLRNFIPGKLLVACLVSLFAITVAIASSGYVFAEPITCPDGETVEASVPTDEGESDPSLPPATTACLGHESADEDDIGGLLLDVVNVLSAAVGVVVVLSIVLAGIQYIWNSDTSAKVEAAKNRLIAAIVSFILFIFGFAILQWLIPGGIFGS